MPREIEEFVHRWQVAHGSERANYQLFLTELCDVLELPRPEPASSETGDAHVLEQFHPRDNRTTRREWSGGRQLQLPGVTARRSHSNHALVDRVSNVTTASGYLS